jgi:hypothetical protein
MFRQQKIILKSVSPLCAVLSRYTWQSEPAHSLALAEESSRQFRDSLPQFGAFSSGQSSILNALLGESLFSVKNKGAAPEVSYGQLLSQYLGQRNYAKRLWRN